MARITLGSLITSISGKLGGIVFGFNKTGPYVRLKGSTVNPNTALQTVIRSIFTVLNTAWREVLDTSQREAWELYAENVSLPDGPTESKNVTGSNMYQRSNVSRLQASLVRVDEAPAAFSLADKDETMTVSASEATQQLSIAFDDTKPWVDEDDAALLIYMGTPQNQTKNFFNGPWRLAGAILGDGTTPPTTPATIAVPFPVTELQKVFVYGRISRADGRLSETFQISGDVGA